MWLTSSLQAVFVQPIPVLSLGSDLRSPSLSSQPPPAPAGEQTSLSGWVNLVCLDTQGTLVSKVLWEILVCLDYRGPLEQKGNQAFLDSLEPQAFLDQKVLMVLLGTLAFQENLVLSVPETLCVFWVELFEAKMERIGDMEGKGNWEDRCNLLYSVLQVVEVVLGHQGLQVKKANQVKMVFLDQLDRRVNQVNQALESQDPLDFQDFLVKRVMEDYLAFQETLAFQVQRVNQAFMVSLVCRVPQALLVLQVQLWKALKATLGPKVLLGDQVQLALQEILDAMDSLALMVQEGTKETQVYQASQVSVVWMVPPGQMDCKVPQVPLEPPLLPMDFSSHVTARQQMHHNAHRELSRFMKAFLS
ncbi:hypothetical protein J1605_010556 [Eschrichtius robustus]|uniref:Uncharacterized protein n=1 Tax=Eschrichtius robustus TaxID=9764 RepID=A0AB34GPN5_ESCRO|nr:hypothetical protein J1605_010556 [Eschrichtius robustus]